MSQQTGHWRVTQAETFRELLVDPPLLKNLPGPASVVGREHFPEPRSSLLVNVEQFLPLVGLRINHAGICRNRNAASVSDDAHRLRKANPVDQHHKLKDVSSGVAAEAVKKLFIS